MTGIRLASRDWSYGLNSWGWDGVLDGGTLDYKNMIVPLDFERGGSGAAGLTR